MKEASQKIRDGLAYAGARILHSAVGMLPQNQQKTLVRRLGILAFHLFRQRRRIGERNMALVRDKLNPELLPSVFENHALTIQEFFLGPWSDGDVSGLRVADSCREIHRTILEHPGGLVFASAHLGNWEVLGAHSGSLGVLVNAVVRPLDNPWLDRWVFRQRVRFGQGVISKRRSPLATAIGYLRAGKNVVLLADQRPRKHFVTVNFLGIPTATTIAPAVLSVRTGSPVVPACAIRTETPNQLLVLLGDPIYPNCRRSDREAEIQRITQEFTQILEGWIRLYPEQWNWLHRRWPKPEYKTLAPPRRPAEFGRRSASC